MGRPRVSYVVIGRNEAPRLARCLQAVLAQTVAPREVLYVDGGSTDGSVAIAAGMPGVQVLHVVGAPNAAKGRNLGWHHARAELVQFVDGDAELAPGWAEAAVAAMAADQRMAAVSGRLLEARPERNAYHRFAALDWPHETGPVASFGGIVMLRRRCLEETGGFPEAALSGEEPLLAAELRRRGYAIHRLATAMAHHDIDLPDFRRYWQRCVITGISLGEQCAPERHAGTRWWQLRAMRNLVLLGAAGCLAGLALWQPWLWVTAAVLVAADAGRLAQRHRQRAGGWWPALTYAGHLRLIAVAQTVGLWRWWLHHVRRRFGRDRDPASTSSPDATLS